MYTDMAYRSIVPKNRIYTFPEILCEMIAKITEDFSFAYLKELFLSTLLGLARENLPDLNNEDEEQPETLILWQRLQAEVEALRKDMSTKAETAKETELGVPNSDIKIGNFPIKRPIMPLQ